MARKRHQHYTEAFRKEAGLVDQSLDYPWSSYHCYASKVLEPKWLYRDDIYAQLSVKTRLREKYQAYVEMDTDDEIAKFYGKGNQVPYLGGDTFRDWAYRQRSTDESSLDRAAIQSFRPRLEEVVNLLAKEFKVDSDNIRTSQRGRANIILDPFF